MKRALPQESWQQRNELEKFSAVHCYVDEDLACYGILVGMLLENKRRNADELALIRDGCKFHQEATSEVEKFLARSEFTIQNIEDHFKRSIGFVKNMRKHPNHIITRAPKDVVNCVWFEDISLCKRFPKICRAEVRLLLNFGYQDVLDGLSTRPAQDIRVKDLSNALFLLGIKAPFEIFHMKRLRYLEKKYDVNIHLYERTEHAKTTIQTRNPLKQPFKHHLHLLINTTTTSLNLSSSTPPPP